VPNPLRVGIVGCGSISGIYFQNLAAFPETEVVGCADLITEKAQNRGVPTYTTEDLINSPDVDLILNLTIPAQHYDVAKAALNAGKHVYNEKPLAVELEQGKELVQLAKTNNVKLGCAPDTFLGAGLQTCRKLLDEGLIGAPVAAQMFMTCHGHESWHPSPEFYYKPGGGPLMDMGPYYLTAMVHLIGSIKNVTGMARASFPERLITSQPLNGTKISVETPTHISCSLEFQQGAIADGCFSFDIWHTPFPPIVIHGTEGSMQVPDPNMFGGPILVRLKDDKDWRKMPLQAPYEQNSRGLGVRDIAIALQTSTPHRASGELALHVLEAMHAVLQSAETGAKVELKTTVQRPEPMHESLHSEFASF
jgi:predicted dehydrogenase